MMKRSLLFSAALGLLASLAFATPSQAGYSVVTQVNYGSLFNSGARTVSEIDLTYSTYGSVSSINTTELQAGNFTTSTSSSVTSGGAGTDVVKLLFSPGATYIHGSFTFFESGSSMIAQPTASVTYGTGTPIAAPTAVVTTVTAPEPSSMALLGIGMTSFLAFRRFFKRAPAA